ncbi:MAG: hypothetical protein PHC61_15540, partial [Chitinivibrionales bacterium]|nr:hypothetical protein [Chitinivibrionales bacterium]
MKDNKLYRGISVHMVPHAHIDMLWLWDWRETLSVFKNTFGGMLHAMGKNSQFTYTQNSAVAYCAVEKHFPALFKKIQKFAGKGQWEISGGAWVEAFEAIASGESIVRNYFYGKKYFKDKFNLDVTTAFNAEGTAFAPCLPQILKQSGIDRFVVGRQTEFSEKWRPLCAWKGNDGTAVTVACLRHYWHPFFIDTCNPYTPQTINEVRAYSSELRFKHGLKDVLYVFGQGDHGGNPDKRDVKNILEMIKTRAQPRVRFSTFRRFFDAALKHTPAVPVIDDLGGRNSPARSISLGCSWARHKRSNAMAESKMISAEFLAALCFLRGLPHRQEVLDALWKEILFNQFHDVAWGSCIEEVRRHTERSYRSIQRGLDLHTHASRRLL